MPTVPNPNDPNGSSAPVGSTATGQVANGVQGQPSDPINPYMGLDTTYLDQLRNFQSQMADFQADAGLRRQQSQEDYELALHQLERQQEKDSEANMDDFSGRGILRSGLYAESVGDMNRDYADRETTLQRGLTRALSSIDQEGMQLQRQQNRATEQAKLDAIRRRAATLASTGNTAG